jgi:tetratricopeptide (TPR) repeat protein
MVALLAGRLLRTRAVAAACVVALVVGVLSWRTVSQAATWQDTVTLWEHTVRVNPRSFVANLNLGVEYRRRGHWEGALACFVTCTELDPEFARTKQDAAIAARMTGRHEQSLAFYRDAIETADRRGFDTWSFRLEHAAYLAQLGRRDEAIAAYEAMIRPGISDEQWARVQAALAKLRR